MEEDERDRLIEFTAMNRAFALFGAAMLAALAALAPGRPAGVLHDRAYATIAAGLLADLTRNWLHRRGV